MSLPPDIRSDLRRLFDTFETNVSFAELEESAPLLLVGSPADSLLFRGDSLNLLRRLQRNLAGSALARGGPSPEVLETLLVETCRTAIAEGAEQAEKYLDSRLGEPLEEWLIAESYLPLDEARLGACEITKGLPDDLASSFIVEALREDFDGPVISTTVLARDQESARLLARDRIEEARSIVILLNRKYREPSPQYLKKASSSGVGVAGGRNLLLAHQLYDEDGRIHPTYAPASLAAAKPEWGRNDWERRTLAAIRWLARAIVTTWPSEALIANMVALESLFVEGASVPLKGKAISAAVTERLVLKHHSAEEQREWLRRLYRERNSATHEGRQYAEDLEVDRLVVVAGEDERQPVIAGGMKRVREAAFVMRVEQSAAAVSAAALDLVSCDTQGFGENACIVGGQEDLNSFSRRTDPKRDVASRLIRYHAPGLDVPDAVQATRHVLSPEGQVHAHRFGATEPSSWPRRPS